MKTSHATSRAPVRSRLDSTVAFAIAVVAALPAALGPPTPAAAQEMRYAERIVYGGFRCRQVQRDSIAYPANEIAILVTVSELETGRTYQTALPSAGGHYDNISAGSIRFTSRPVWEGPAQSVDVHVVMIEVDGDKGALQGLSRAAFTAIQVAYSRGSRPAPAVSSGGSGGNPAADLAARGLGKVFGTGDDLVGHAYMHVEDADRSGYWWESPLTSYFYVDTESGTRARVKYHFKTRIRRGDADCTVYFAFQRGAELGYESATLPPSRQPPPEKPRRVPTAGVYDLEGIEYLCEIEGRDYHLKEGSMIAYAADGSYSRPGRAWGARDTLCHFELDFYGGGGTYCVGDLGKVTLGDADGPQRGRCWICDADECRD